MAHHGPRPGSPPQPWSTDDSAHPYGAPADPWGEHHVGWSGGPASTEAQMVAPTTDFGPTGGYAPAPLHPPGHGGPPVWTAQPPPRRRGPGALMVLLVVGLSVLACGGLGVAGWLLTHRSDREAASDVTPKATVGGPAGGEVTPAPRNSRDARFVAKGQCVRNAGTANAPQMSIVPCGSGTYEVLARIDGQTTGSADAETKCAGVRNYTKWYFYDSELDSLDFVLCLRER